MVQRARPVGPGSRRSDDRTTPQDGEPRRAVAVPYARRPWQRPAQRQHGAPIGAPEDVEATGALLARLAAARAWVGRPPPPTWRRVGVFASGSVPFGRSRADDAAIAYLRLLDQVLADRVITDAEVCRLRKTAMTWGIGALEIESLHRGYVARVWEAALADERITDAERDDITLLARLLGTPLPPLVDARPDTVRRWVALPIEPETEGQVASSRPPWAARPKARGARLPRHGARRTIGAGPGGTRR